VQSSLRQQDLEHGCERRELVGVRARARARVRARARARVKGHLRTS
jgi:hypothetical protein